jgi:hypothetical protein
MVAARDCPRALAKPFQPEHFTADRTYELFTSAVA